VLLLEVSHHCLRNTIVSACSTFYCFEVCSNYLALAVDFVPVFQSELSYALVFLLSSVPCYSFIHMCMCWWFSISDHDHQFNAIDRFHLLFIFLEHKFKKLQLLEWKRSLLERKGS